MNEIRKIFKYPLEIADASEIMLPAGAKILSVGEEGEGIILYAVVVPWFVKENVLQKISIRMVETGKDITFDLNEFKFLGTFAPFHIFYHDHGYYG